MRPMFEGEFSRFRRAVWFIQKLLIVTPLIAAWVAWWAWRIDVLGIALLVLIQNLIALWVLAQYEYKRW